MAIDNSFELVNKNPAVYMTDVEWASKYSGAKVSRINDAIKSYKRADKNFKYRALETAALVVVLVSMSFVIVCAPLSRSQFALGKEAIMLGTFIALKCGELAAGYYSKRKRLQKFLDEAHTLKYDRSEDLEKRADALENETSQSAIEKKHAQATELRRLARTSISDNNNVQKV